MFSISSFTNTFISSCPARRCVIPPLLMITSSSFALAITAGLRLQEAATWVISCVHMALVFWSTLLFSSYPHQRSLNTYTAALQSLLVELRTNIPHLLDTRLLQRRATSHLALPERSLSSLQLHSAAILGLGTSGHSIASVTQVRENYAARGPSALLITMMSACSMIPFFSPCSSSPIAGGISSITMSTISSIITSD